MMNNTILKDTEIDLSSKIDKDLSHKVSKGVLWVTVSGTCSRGLGIISSIILARLLLPSDYGLLAITTTIVFMMQGLTTTGFGSALIQKQEKSEEFNAMVKSVREVDKALGKVSYDLTEKMKRAVRFPVLYL